MTEINVKVTFIIIIMGSLIVVIELDSKCYGLRLKFVANTKPEKAY